MDSPQFEKYRVFLPNYCSLDCDDAADVIVNHARQNKSFGVTALAVHGLIESIRDSRLGEKINKIDLIVPDGQPIVWALNSFYRLGIKTKIPGPTLTLTVLQRANKLGLKVYLYGSTADTLNHFQQHITRHYPDIDVCGVHVDRFRDATLAEDAADIEKINSSGAHIVLVGRGCPRQEHWVADHIDKINASMMAVGAAFDYHAGKLQRAPSWMQKGGLEWLYRLIQEPGRLWKRYLITNSMFVFLFVKHKLLAEKP